MDVADNAIIKTKITYGLGYSDIVGVEGNFLTEPTAIIPIRSFVHQIKSIRNPLSNTVVPLFHILVICLYAENIPLVNLLAVLVAQARKLADADRINKYTLVSVRNQNLMFALPCGDVGVLDIKTLYPLFIVEALTPEFNFSIHFLLYFAFRRLKFNFCLVAQHPEICACRFVRHPPVKYFVGCRIPFVEIVVIINQPLDAIFDSSLNAGVTHPVHLFGLDAGEGTEDASDAMVALVVQAAILDAVPANEIPHIGIRPPEDGRYHQLILAADAYVRRLVVDIELVERAAELVPLHLHLISLGPATTLGGAYSG